MKEYKYAVTCTVYKTKVVIIKADSENDADAVVQEMIDNGAIGFGASANSEVEFNYDVIDVNDVEDDQ
jgi:hypothetical protein